MRAFCCTERRAAALAAALLMAGCAGAPPPAPFAPTAAQDAQAEQAVAALEAERTNRLQRELQPLLGAQPTGHGLVVVLPDALFQGGRAALQPDGLARLDDLAAVLRRHPQRRVLVEGYADAEHAADAARANSLTRAQAVRQALVERGVAPERIEVRGEGAARPVAASASPAGREHNRRVEVVLSDGRGRFAPDR